MRRPFCIVDATIIHAPSSTKNAQGERDPEMHQTRKGNQWYFGMKAHIGMDSKSGIVHSVCTTAASVADKHMLADLLHGDERKVWGDGGYQGQGETIRQAALHAQDMTSRRTRYKDYVDQLQRAKNRVKARVKAKVEHPFRIVKRIFGFEKTRYRGLRKNHQRLCVNFALAHVYLNRRRLASLGALCLRNPRKQRVPGNHHHRETTHCRFHRTCSSAQHVAASQRAVVQTFPRSLLKNSFGGQNGAGIGIRKPSPRSCKAFYW
jgi:IS5 family transposase